MNTGELRKAAKCVSIAIDEPVAQDLANKLIWAANEIDRLSKNKFERIARLRFKNIIKGKGSIIPRIAVKIALDDIFKDENQENRCGFCGLGPEVDHNRCLQILTTGPK